ncbi:MAG TPA: hypothetical protein VLX67_05385 [Stellaceae bacterium]|nr:hypothetical protein [Stellaceae bacterium]
MAKTAMLQLQDQIEAIRREAYAAGYAAAMQAIRDFAARPGTAAAPVRRGRSAKAAPAAGRRGRPPSARAAAKPRSAGRRRPQRGTNARLVAEILKALPASSGRPADIRAALTRDKGVTMAYTSIRHSLGQLQARGEVTGDPDGKTWRYTGPVS